MTLGQWLRRLDERAGIDRLNYKTPRARIPFAIVLQLVAVVVVGVAGGAAWVALPLIAGTIGLLIGFLRDTRE
jgi:fatty acid desaturase